MKKAYITPALNAVKIESAQMLAGSDNMGIDDKEVSSGWSNKYQGGFLWEDNDTEAQ